MYGGYRLQISDVTFHGCIPGACGRCRLHGNKGMVTMYARQLAGETNDSLRQLNVSHIKAAHLFRDSIDEVKSSQLILLYVYSPYDSGSYNNNDTGLDGVDSIQMGYHVLKDTEDDDTAYYDYDSYSMDDTRVAAPVFFKWVDAVEVKKISDSERIFLAKIPRKALKGKDGVNIEYRFNKMEMLYIHPSTM